ncbi:MAG TPA: carboxypeptidase-like regulatory domain-containing protein [Candidatus Angelobacter sp.]|nr:carboxypeptidase-like regulatory domain-containing protein [Candidatus Angelobacter sp.]
MKRVEVKLLLGVFVMAVFGALLLLPAPAQAKPRPQTFRSLTGHVFSKDNKPVSKAVVYLKNTKTHQVENYISDPDGSYHFPWLSPTVDYEVHAEFKGASTDTKMISSFDTRKQLDIVLRLR